jgi:type IV pilus assembly protein PilV
MEAPLTGAPRRVPGPSRQAGFALLEALIAILLFSLGILALMALQAQMNKHVTQARLRSEASFLASQLIGQMWLDQEHLAGYAIAGNACKDSGLSSCARWRMAVEQGLPQGQAEVQVDGDAVRIALSWRVPGEAVASFDIGARVTH